MAANEERIKEFRKDLEKIREDILREFPQPPRADICTLYLQGKSIDVKFLKEDVEAFDNPEKHFTKEYRILEGLCNKLLLDLDKIEVIGRDDLKEPRKQALKEVNEILTKLEAKVHESGDACEDCEIKN